MINRESADKTVRYSRLWRRSAAALVALAGMAASVNPASAATRSYVVSWFTQGMYSTENDCPGGINPPIEKQWVKDLMDLGMTRDEAQAIVVRVGNGDRSAHDIIVNRGRINGQPVNAYNNPQAVKDPMMVAVDSKYGVGFNLDGKGAASPNGFEDPETGEKGVNNQMARALGCIFNLRAKPPLRSSDTEQWWHLIQDYQPAWLISIDADDFKNSSTAKITFDRALEHPSWDANSETRRNMTYRIDPDPRSHTEIKGSIKDGVFHAATEQTLFMVGDLLVMPALELHKTHVRIKIQEDGSLDGYLGGYQPWVQVYFPIAAGGNAFEMNVAHDIPGIYYLLKKNADAEPDPKTGENTAISATWRIEAVPSFNVPIETAKSGTKNGGGQQASISSR